jgi:hypothetical protein
VGIGPHAYGTGQGNVSAAAFLPPFLGLYDGKVHEPGHPAAGYAPGFPIGYSLLDHLTTLPMEQERGMAVK